MGDTPASGSNDKKWIFGAVSTTLAVAAFLGVHNFSELKGALNSSTAAATGPTPSAAPAHTCLLYCITDFIDTGAQFTAGKCTSDSGCPMSGTFKNMGAENGAASATFYLHPKDSNGMNKMGETVGSCTVAIPPAPEFGVVTAGCAAFPTAPGPYGLEVVINNPVATG